MRRLKVDVDLDSGHVILKLPVRDFKEIAVAASLNCYDGRDRARRDDEPEHVAYHNGLLQFIKGIECLIDMQARPYVYEDPIPLVRYDVKVRRAAVEHEIRERELLDQIFEEASNTPRGFEPGTDGESLQAAYPERRLCSHKYADGSDATTGVPVSGERWCNACKAQFD